jgi:glycosyltransferase involved in cell wall biosynthesis
MKRAIAIWLLALPLLAYGKQTICLNMIVKNESEVIRRCLDSVKPYIDRWVIVDTGSTDGTQEIIRNYLAEIPGELYESPWKNFGESRSEAFEFAKGKGDYILFMDADDILEFDEGFQFGELTADLYNMWRGIPGFQYLKPQLVKGDMPWKWVGVTHEYLGCDADHNDEVLTGVRYASRDDGASSHDPKKFQKNIDLLTEGLKQEPTNSRYMFYLAESYRDASESGKALEMYQKRAKMGGWDEEIFWSKFQIGEMMQRIGISPKVVLEAHKEAHAYRPHRVEPVYHMATLYNELGDHEQAYRCIKEWLASEKPKERDALFNVVWMEDYGLLFQLSICAHYVGKYQEAIEVCNRLMSIAALPESWRQQTAVNITFPLAKLAEQTEK